MQDVNATNNLWYKFELLDAVQQEMVLAFVDSLIAAQSADRVDKEELLKVSVWGEEDSQQVKHVQDQINLWQIPSYDRYLVIPSLPLISPPEV
ncbi:MAG: hypothetical protein R2873_06275 [Caldilineaceae bacterium]